MTTKKRICDAALELFEQHGYSAVTMRDIAAAADIAVGNLTYYFPKKGDLVAYLQEGMFDEMYGHEAELAESFYTLSGLAVFVSLTSANRSRNMFLYRDMAAILADAPQVAENTERFHSWLFSSLRASFSHLRETGMARTDIRDEEYEAIVHSILVMTQFWMQRGSAYDESSLPHVELGDAISALIVSCLTDAGLKEWRRLRRETASAR